MTFERCFGCMEETLRYPCPHCGYEPNQAPNPDYALQPGTILHGRYLLGAMLGQGGFGITYIGWDLSLERKVAVKEYYPSGQVSRHAAISTNLQWYASRHSQEARTSGMQMFLREARKMSKVEDIPQLVRVLELFQENETAYIAMDYVEGETLRDRLNRCGPMSWQEAKEIFLPVMQTMQQVHAAGLIHRDLSPDNLKLEPGSTVWILDLGAAKDITIGNGSSSALVTKEGFSPPEMYMQRGESGTWSDVYSLAATLYYALTGVVPMPAIDRMDRDSIRWDLPELQRVPYSAVCALKQAMALRVGDRIQTMECFAHLLLKPNHRRFPKKAAALVGIASLAAVLCVAWLLGSHSRKGVPSQTATNTPSVETTQQATFAATESSSETVAPAQEAKRIVDVAAGRDHTVVLYSDGTVGAAGGNFYGQCSTGDWSGIVQVSAMMQHTVGLKGDGTVLAVGKNDNGQCDVSQWRNIVAISAGFHHTVGLRADGTVVAVGLNSSGECDIQDWRDIVDVKAAYSNTIGLKSDGSVVITGSNGKQLYGWSGIKAINVSDSHFLGLRADGTVKASGSNNHGQCDLDDWTDIMDICGGSGYSVGLKSDGSVLFQGLDDCDQGKSADWHDIILLSSGMEHVVGLRADGQLVAAGANDDGQCDLDALNPSAPVSNGQNSMQEVADAIRGRLPVLTFAVTNGEPICGYTDSALTQKDNRFSIAPSTDQIAIIDITEDGTALLVRFPSNADPPDYYRTLWFPSEDILHLAKANVGAGVADEKVTAYRYSLDGSRIIPYGSMDTGNHYTILGSHESGYQAVLYSIYSTSLCGIQVNEKLALIEP